MLARVLSLGAARWLLVLASILFVAAGRGEAGRISAIARTDPSIAGEFGDATLGWALACTAVAALAASLAWRRRGGVGAGWLASDDGSVAALSSTTRLGLGSAAVGLVAGGLALAASSNPSGLVIGSIALVLACGAAVLATTCAWHALGLVRERIDAAEVRQVLSHGWREPRPTSPARAHPMSSLGAGGRRIAGRLAPLPVVALAISVAYGASSVSVISTASSQLCPPGSGGLCRYEIVPLDHVHPDASRTLSIVYRIVPARTERIGTLVFMTGGPGVRGLSEADARLDDIDPVIRDRFDIVFFDQRGIGGSGGLDCSGAVRASRYDASRAGDAAFASACLSELGSSAAILPYLSSREAAEDVESIRVALDIPRIWIYGESYGTRLAQTYVAEHPDRVAGVVLDGAIDVQRPGLDFWRESSAGFAATLDLALKACAADAACVSDVGPNPVAGFEALVGRLAGGAARSAMPDGWPTATEDFGVDDLLGAVGPAMYTETGRMVVLRALASAERGDWLPFIRLATTERDGPPTSLADPALATWTLLGYYAVECADQDYGADPGLLERLEAVSRGRDPFGLGFAAIVLQERPCAFWPAPADRGAPPAQPEPTVPTLVLASTGDPVTPVANAERIVARLPHADLVVTSGGPHVTFRRDLECVDSTVRAFLVEGRAPNGRRTSCVADTMEPYVPILRAALSLYPDRAAALDAVSTEFTLLPEVGAWDGGDQLTVACPVAGTARLTESIVGVEARLDHCQFMAGLELDGVAGSSPLDGRLDLADLR